jgi:hypothetical protein
MTWVATGTATLTAAEIAAAEAAAVAAATAAAEATAASAASAAAAQGTTTALAAEAAPLLTETAATALPEIAGGAAPEIAQGSILEALPGVTPPPAEPLPPAGLEQLAPAGSTPPPPAEPLPPAGTEPTGIQTAQTGATSDVAGYQQDQQILDMMKNYQGAPQSPTPSPGNAGWSEGFSPEPPVREVGQGIPLQTPAEAAYNAPFEPASSPPGSENGFMQGFSQFAKDNPFLTGVGLYGVASSTGMLNQKSNQPLTPSQGTPYTGPRLSKDFKGGPYSEPNVYKPRYAASGGIMQSYRSGGYNNGADFDDEPGTDNLNDGGQGMASGGIAHYYRGRLTTSTGGKGDVHGATQRFLDMYDPQSRYEPPAGATNPDVGIFHDTNPATRGKAALEAAQIRQNALEERSYVDSGAKYVPPSRNMGELSFKTPGGKDKKEKDYDSVLAASGGIMQASLGGYAAGGNPRLLRGPGDGMSDGIPASIGGRQPARLADGEFVVPADVVSHLGNGSTEAGAKKLHGMMDKVRVDRTGKKKQAPAVKPNKYIPK